MLTDKSLSRNTGLLTAASLVMRLIGMLWQLWLVEQIGDTGIGLFQLVLSVGGLAGTLAVSGVRFSATRLISEELGAQCPGGAWKASRVCLFYAGGFGLAAALILMLSAEPLGFLWLGDARTVSSLRFLAAGLPFLSLSTAVYGYFTATGRVWKSVVMQIGREICMILVTILLLWDYRYGDLEKACACITAASTIADILIFLILFIVFLRDQKKHSICSSGRSGVNITGRMLRIALPLALASYARSGLSTLQHLLVPKGLRRSGLSSAHALAGYGVIQGMALPVVLFPSCLMISLAELIVPKLTEAQVRRDSRDIRATTARLLHSSSVFSIGIAFLFLSLGDQLGLALYDSERAGHYIQIFSLIVPVMYLDMITDGCLKGLGDMMFCMYVNIADAGLSALLVWLFLPTGGLPAYILVICFTELFNFLFSLARLWKTAGYRPNWKALARTLCCAAIAAAAARSLSIGISAGNGVPALIVSLLFGVFIYVSLLNLSPGEAEGRPASW